MRKYDLAVAYRMYSGISKSGRDLFKNKFEMSDICLSSFKKSLGGIRAKIWAIIDDCPKEYEQLFLKYFAAEDLEYVSLNGLGNAATFIKQIEILSSQDLSDYVYFAEDDYLYLPKGIEISLKFMITSKDVDFISLYDHLDLYHLDISRVKSKILIHGDRHWRNVGSTCLTFMARKQILDHTAKIFSTYKNNNYDASIWLSLTKYKVFNLISFFKYLFSDVLYLKIILKSWIYGWRQILFGRKRILWVPIPALATHIDGNCLAPVIDWKKYLDQINADINGRKWS